MVEGRRILRPGGLLWVKCSAEVESHRQRMGHIESLDIAVGELGMIVEDRFVLVRASPPPVQHRQRHSRKNLSYLWVFRREG
jgi:hypothetical protein